ncbi:MAG: radical SAM protein, partial [Halobacteria archaeon]|nr:radical SAM protein [Halobacteria archaeon]
MADAFRTNANVPRGAFDFEHVPETDQSFENALEKARNGERLTVDDGVELMTTGTDFEGIDPGRKELILEAADERRSEDVGDEVTFVANLNNNVTTACNTGCLFCNFKDRAKEFEKSYEGQNGGFTKTVEESSSIVEDALDMGIYEVCSVSGLHPALALDDEHHEILDSSERIDLNYKPPSEYEKDPGTYVEQIEAMSVEGVHVHSMTPEEVYHARRGTDWDYREVYRRLKEAGLDSVPGTAAEIL